MTEDLKELIVVSCVCGFIILGGVYFLFCSIFSLFNIRFRPINLKKWKQTRAKVIFHTEYKEKSISQYHIDPYIINKATNIEYVVNGITYKKSISYQERSGVRIFYKIKNPNYFKTITEIQSKRYNANKLPLPALITMLLFAFSLILIGIVIMQLFWSNK